MSVIDPTDVPGHVVDLRDGVATVLVGEEAEEWYFPAHMLPEGIGTDTAVRLAGSGRDLRVVGADRPAPAPTGACGPITYF